MKKYLAIIIAAALALTLCACAGNGGNEETEPADTTAADVVENPDDTQAPAVDGAMSFADYNDAELGSEVTVAAYVQASQGSWEDSETGNTLTTVYLQNEEGAYFVYEMAIDAADAEKITTPGTLVKVTGTKSEWNGEVEITDVTAYEIVDAEAWVAEATDVTEKLGTDDIDADKNKFVTVKGAVVEAYDDEGAAFLYKYDGSGEKGDDLYFKVNVNGAVYTFVVESYLCGQDTEVYQAVEALNVGDTIDLEGFLYWYEKPQLQATALTLVEADAPAEEATEEAAEEAAE